MANAVDEGYLLPMVCHMCGESSYVPYNNRVCPECDTEGATFFGRKPFDMICFDNDGKIQCSGGNLEDLIETAEKFNWAVAALIPIKFSRGKR